MKRPELWPQLRQLTEISRALTYAASLEEASQLAVDRAAELIGAETALLLIKGEAGPLTVRASRGVDAAVAQGFAVLLSEAVVAQLAAALGVEAANVLALPLVVNGEIDGLLVVVRPRGAPASERDEWLVGAIADQAAVALEKTRMVETAGFREQLMGIVGHDLRNPLQTISVASHLLLLREGMGAKETELVRKIAAAGASASKVVEQLLDLTRSRLGGGIPLDVRRVDLGEICRQLIGETELKHLDRPLRVQLEGDLAGTWDRDRLYQLLANLIGNAVQHGAAQSPIDLRAEGGRDEVVIAVGSRGAPIPPAMLPVIFNAFRKNRPPQPGGTPTAGLGLGLFIAQQIARAHRGSIAVASSESAGTVFRVRLPRS